MGYARFSTGDRNLDLQQDALTKHSREQTFTKVAIRAREERDGLHEDQSYVRCGDVLVVGKMVWLGCNRCNKVALITIFLAHENVFYVRLL